MNTDTIAAISTSLNESGIGIIRLSGDEAIDVADKIYVNKNRQHTLSTYKTHTIHYGFILDSENKIIDEVMISVFKAPDSYTKENIIEINCHGGIRVCKTILELVIANGARPADPGEFTKRAFLNGRIDLSQAEAVMDVIKSESDLSLSNSINQLQGSLSKQLNNICDLLLYEIAFIESALDDPDSISLDGYSERLETKCSEIIELTDRLIESYDEGKIITEGINTVILGKPNAGKSSLLNHMLKNERAIVTNIPGTTRDTLTEKMKLGDAVLNITDTAGIRQTNDPIELIGVEKAKKAIDSADLIIYMIDSSVQTDNEEEEIIGSLPNKPLILLLNKTDLIRKTDVETVKCLFEKHNKKTSYIIETTLKEDTISDEKYIEELKDAIKELFYSEKLKSNNQIIITNIRHVNLLKHAEESLKKVIESIRNGISEDFYSIDLTDAYSYLAAITGREVSEDIVNEIFSKFCMGK